MEFIGWMLAVAAAVRLSALRRRLVLVARAEHELRGPLTTLLLALPREARLDTEIARVRLGLADLAAARSGRRAPPAIEDVTVGELTVRADADRLSQALGNLVANAREHGAEPISIEAARHGDVVTIEVTDGGPGLHGQGLRIAADAARDSGGELRVSPRGFPTLYLRAAE